MNKRILNIILTLLVCFCLLVGCNQTSDNDIVKEPITTNDVRSDSDTVNQETNDVRPDSDTVNQETEINEIGGGDVLCPVHNVAYHAYPNFLISYIEEERFMEWANEVSITRDNEGCYPDGNILICVEYFDVPDDVILEIYKNDYVNSDWNIEALLDHDAEALEEDARNKASSEEYQIYSEKMRNEISLKYELFDIMKSKNDIKTANYFNKITENGTTYPVYEVTFSNMVTNTSLTKADLNDALDRITQTDTATDKFHYFEYNFDLLFDTDTTVMATDIEEIEAHPYESEIKLTDALLHITDNTDVK